MTKKAHCRAVFLYQSALSIVLATLVALTPQKAVGQGGVEPASTPGAEIPKAKEIKVEERTSDQKIAERIEGILTATGWFQSAEVEAQEGIVFLHGMSSSEEHRKWAGDLTERVEGVVAVVNQIRAHERLSWDFEPAKEELRRLAHAALSSIPWLGLAAVILLLSLFGASFAGSAAVTVFRRRVGTPLLVKVLARLVSLLVILFGVYLVLRIAGLTRLAVTVIGGTGLFGLVLGIAFRDITENFLASLFLSIYRPFRSGDLIEIGGETGYVQQLNTRSTVLMTLNGSHLQIPNSTVFKSTIRNYSTNPNRREEFIVGVGYNCVIQDAQRLALEVLGKHPAVLKDPPPAVLADNLGASTINLKVYFWLDGSKHSWLKVRSSVIRLVKKAFQEQGISMPDEARELIFPNGVPVRILPDQAHTEAERDTTESRSDDEPIAVKGEGELGSEAHQLFEQASRARPPEEGSASLDLSGR